MRLALPAGPLVRAIQHRICQYPSASANSGQFLVVLALTSYKIQKVNWWCNCLNDKEYVSDRDWPILNSPFAHPSSCNVLT
jgi:hypothetical protein